MPFRVRVVALCVTLILTLTAAAGSVSFDATYLLATAGLGLIAAGARHVIVRDRQRERWEYRTDTALWGPEDANGKRNVEAGVVAMMERNTCELRELKSAVNDLAEAAKQAADAAIVAVAAVEHETPSERRRLND